MTEASDQRPINAYGAAQRVVENILTNFQNTFGLNHFIFRYFNFAGADPKGTVGGFHRPETHLIPLILDTVGGKRDELKIFGTDYDTPEGHVCVCL